MLKCRENETHREIIPLYPAGDREYNMQLRIPNRLNFPCNTALIGSGLIHVIFNNTAIMKKGYFVVIVKF